MRFLPTPLSGVVLIEPVRSFDERGSFARVWCEREFEEAGLSSRVVQCNVSMNTAAGTLRGMHYQAEPHGEVKVVRCTAGRIFDVVVDLRPSSPTFRQWAGFELSPSNGHALYVPVGIAHGFQTLEDDSTVEYQMSEFFAPDHARGVRHDDPAFGIRWPREVSVISPRDASYPDVTP